MFGKASPAETLLSVGCSPHLTHVLVSCSYRHAWEPHGGLVVLFSCTKVVHLNLLFQCQGKNVNKNKYIISPWYFVNILYNIHDFLSSGTESYTASCTSTHTNAHTITCVMQENQSHQRQLKENSTGSKRVLLHTWQWDNNWHNFSPADQIRFPTHHRVFTALLILS